MQCITACVLSYDPTVVATWCTQLWEALKWEILTATEDGLAKEALMALQAIALQLSAGIVISEMSETIEKTALSRYTSQIVKECIDHLQEPQHRYAIQSGQILEATAAASSPAFTLIAEAATSRMLTIYQDTDAILKKKALLEVFGQLLQSALSLLVETSEEGSTSVNLSKVGKADEAVASYEKFSDPLFEIFLAALTSTSHQEISFRMSALHGLLKLIRLPHFVSNEEVVVIIHELNDVILTQERLPNEVLQKEAIKALQIVAAVPSYTDFIKDQTFPAFLSKLPESVSDSATSMKTLMVLEDLAKISSNPTVFSLFSRRLISKLRTVLNNGSSPHYAHAILSALFFGLSTRNLREDGDVFLRTVCYHEIVEPLYRMCVELKFSEAGEPYVGLKRVRSNVGTGIVDDMTLTLIGKTANYVVRNAQATLQSEITKEVLELFVHRDGKPASHPPPLLQDLSNTPQAEKGTVILSLYLLAGLKANVC